MTNPDNRTASDKLRDEFGITERAVRGGPPPGEPLATAADVRALRKALQLTGKQFAARFHVPMGTLLWWSRRPDQEVVGAPPEVIKLLRPILERARELGALKYVAIRTKRVPTKLCPTKQVPYKPRSTLKRFRCTQCGVDLRQKDVRTGNHDDLYHERDGEGCGPVRSADVTGAA